MWENRAVTMSEGVLQAGFADAEPWLDADDLRWFPPPDTEGSSAGRGTLRQVEASLGDLTRAAAAALTPHPLASGSGTIAVPAPSLPPRAGERSYRDARRQRWSPRRRKRFATRFVPAATLVVSAAVTLPSLLARDDRRGRIGEVRVATPQLRESGSSAALLPRAPATDPRTRAADGATPFQIASVGSGDLLGEAYATSELVPPIDSGADTLAPPEPAAPAAAEQTAPRYERIKWRESSAHGVPFGGHLHEGVSLPIKGRDWISWDPAHNRVPNRAWRMNGTDKLVRTIVRIARAHRAANPSAPPLLIGDLSAPEGGHLDHHSSHQNGLDVDIYYPRKDGKPIEPTSPGQVDVKLAQDLVDRFVRAGAQFVFVGYSTGVTGPSGVVQPYPHHENHLHVRLYP